MLFQKKFKSGTTLKYCDKYLSHFSTHLLVI